MRCTRWGRRVPGCAAQPHCSTSAVVSPFHAGEAQFKMASAPMYIAVSQAEAIAGGSIVFAKKAARNGFDNHLDVYQGMWHVSPMCSEDCGNIELWRATVVLNRIVDFFREISQRASGMSPGERVEVVADGAPLLHVHFLAIHQYEGLGSRSTRRSCSTWCSTRRPPRLLRTTTAAGL
ncbi:unnamed protein product [Prorocentrum cordatum]|uniref:Uncharacterized protein n=1 Tax=Prorocentrum cordatum TaxID=2364126 RepID=A0ABN9UN18_9DINO|nr:unnamed protein product [Polarella glacialis]